MRFSAIFVSCAAVLAAAGVARAQGWPTSPNPTRRECLEEQQMRRQAMENARQQIQRGIIGVPPMPTPERQAACAKFGVSLP